MNKNPHLDSIIDRNVPRFGWIFSTFPAINSYEYVSPFSYDIALSVVYTSPTLPTCNDGIPLLSMR